MKTKEIVKRMKQVFQESGYSPTVGDECSIRGLVVKINEDQLKGKLSVHYDSGEKLVSLTLCFQEDLPEENRDILYESLNEFNRTLPISHFGICPYGGGVILQTSYFITGDFDPVKFRQTVGQLLREGVDNYPLLKGLTFAEPASA